MPQYVKDIRWKFKQLLKDEKFVIDKSGVKTIELVGESFIADKDAIFSRPDSVYIAKELVWYMGKVRNINAMQKPIPAIWKAIAGENGEVNSNYGWCVFSSENHSQFSQACFHLKTNKNSRQAILIYTRPSIHFQAFHNGMNDFICTNTVQYLIRENKLDCVVNMRSNDAIFGYKNDYAWQRYVHIKVLLELTETYPDLELGQIFWQTGSLHIYERHFDLVKKESHL